MFIEINCIIKLSHCLNYWSVNAPGRSARSRPLAAARLGPIAPRTRTIGIDRLYLGYTSLKQQNQLMAINGGDSTHASDSNYYH